MSQPDDGDDELLGRLLGRMIEEISDGNSVELAELAPDRPDLRGRLRELHELANQVAVRRPLRFPTVPGYDLLRELGRGGMGEVYLARQQRLDRVVALKCLSLWRRADSHARDRFAREVRVVAKLKHPHIVPIFDVGEADGIPYFTMEYVEGRSLAAVLDGWRTHADGRGGRGGRAREERSSATICRIVLDVAEALDHAHGEGIVHRDVKPSNILVRKDGRALLFDFGLARTESDASLTQTGDFVGTPHYVTPEQIVAGGEELDARADVYSLGVTLFELLTLQVPFSGASAQVVLRKIQDDEPPPPRRLNPDVPRDLQTICLTAMARDRGKRYQSAAELAADLHRFLALRPILARPIGWVGRSVRLVRRHPTAAIATLLALLLLVGTPTTLWLQQRAATREITAKANKVEAIDHFLQKVFASADPGQDGRQVKVVELLDDAVAELDHAFPDEPEIEVALRNTVAQTYDSLGLCESAESVVRRGLALAERALGAEHPDRLAALSLLGLILEKSSRYAESEKLLLEAVRLEARVRGESAPQTLTARHNLAVLYLDTMRYDEAIPLLERTLAARRQVLGDRDPSTLASLMILGSTLLDRGDAEAALPLIAESEALVNSITSDHDPQRFVAACNRARAMSLTGDADGAEQLLRGTLELQQNHLGAAHPDTLDTMGSLAKALLDANRLEEAEELCSRTLALRRESRGDRDQATLAAMSDLGLVLGQEGKLDEAARLYAEALPLQISLFGADHRGTLNVMNSKALVLQGQGKLREAEELYDEVLLRRRRLFGDDDPDTVIAIHNLACALDVEGEHERAEKLFAEALERSGGSFSPLDLASMRGSHGVCLLRLARIDEAESELLKSYAGFTPGTDGEHPSFRNTLEGLVTLYEARGMEEEAATYRALLGAR